LGPCSRIKDTPQGQLTRVVNKETRSGKCGGRLTGVGCQTVTWLVLIASDKNRVEGRVNNLLGGWHGGKRMRPSNYGDRNESPVRVELSGVQDKQFDYSDSTNLTFIRISNLQVLNQSDTLKEHFRPGLQERSLRRFDFQDRPLRDSIPVLSPRYFYTFDAIFTGTGAS
jgi:hypothetical protein